jgi:hypothetical protein
MVARRLRTKCATCGATFPAPKGSAYCNKVCERSRRGLEASESADAEALLAPVFEERLQLRQRLAVAPRHEHADIIARLVRTERREAIVREAIESGTVDRSSLAHWATIVRRECDSWEVSLRRSLAAGIRLGAKLIEAKSSLPHGEFGRLFSDHDDAVPNSLPFTRHWGGKLMSIAANGVTGIAAHAQQLPADLETVYVLSRIPPADLQAAIQAGSVSPKTTRAAARTLVTGESEPSEPEQPEDPIDALLDPIRLRLAAFAADHPDLLNEAATRLKGILRGIARVAAGGGAS